MPTYDVRANYGGHGTISTVVRVAAPSSDIAKKIAGTLTGGKGLSTVQVASPRPSTKK